MSEEKKQRLKEYQKHNCESKKSDFFVCFTLYKMRKEIIFNNGHSNYSIDKYYFRKDKKTPLILMK